MIDINQIMEVLPHRYPFLLIDRVVQLDSKTIRAIKNVTINEPFFCGHFPQRPVMPGVLVVEALAQAAGYLLFSQLDDREGKLIFFTGIDNCRFRRPVEPGDQLVFDVKVLAARSNFAKIRGQATVDGEVVCEADLMSAMVEE